MSSATSHLNAGRVNVSLLRDDCRNRLINFLNQFSGTKTIIWDKELMSPSNLLVDLTSLLIYGANRMIELSSRALTTITTSHVVFLIRGRIEIINVVASAIKQADKSAVNVKYHLLLVPRGTLLAETKLAEQGVLGSFETIVDLPLVFPLDSDLLTLDMSCGLYEYAVTGDMSLVYDVASSLMYLQSIYGTIPVIRGIGSAARIVVDLMHKLRHEQQGDTTSSCSSQLTSSNLIAANATSLGDLADSPLDGLSSRGHKIDSLLLIDRRVDMVTPFLTQFTYEGLIDEFFGIRHNSVKLPANKFPQESNDGTKKSTDSPASPQPESETKTFILSSAEELYIKLRDLNFASVGPSLTAVSKRLTSMKTETHAARSVKELRAIVDRLPYFQTAKKSVVNHIAIAELIKNKVEDDLFQEIALLEKDLLNLELNEKEVPLIETLIYTGCTEDDLILILKLICLQSQTTGIRKSTLDFYKRELIDSFGASLLPVFYYLESSGLLRTASSSLSVNLLSPQSAGQRSHNRSPSLTNIFSTSTGRESVASNGSNGSNSNPFSPLTQSAYAVASAVTSAASNATGNNYSILKKCLTLTNSNYSQAVNQSTPSANGNLKQLYSMYSGYVPLSIKLVQLSLRPGWSSGSLDALRILAPVHSAFEEIQCFNNSNTSQMHNVSQSSPVVVNNSNSRSLGVPSTLTRRNSSSSLGSSPGHSNSSSSALMSPSTATGATEDSKVILVVFIGGCTLGEVSGLRLLSQVEESNVEFITLTTKILTAKNLLKSFTSASAKSFNPVNS